MPSPCLNPARQLPIPLPVLGSAPGMWEQPRRASPRLSVIHPGSGKGRLQHCDLEAPTWDTEAEEEEGEMSVHAHGSLSVWDKLNPVARGVGHHPGPASLRPSTPVVTGPA